MYLTDMKVTQQVDHRICLSCEIYSPLQCKHEGVDRCAVERAVLVAYKLGFEAGQRGDSSLTDEGEIAVLEHVGRIAGTWDSSPRDVAELKRLGVVDSASQVG